HAARRRPPPPPPPTRRSSDLVTSSYRRVPPQSLSPSIKSLNYLNNIMARVEANQYGADEALMLDIHGYVSEATADNFFIVRNSTDRKSTRLNSSHVSISYAVF